MFFHENSQRLISFPGGPSSNIRLNNESNNQSKNPLIWKWYILLNLRSKFSLLKWLICGNDYLTLHKNRAQRKSWRSVNVYTDPERSFISTEYIICSINRVFSTYLDCVYVYKDFSKIMYNTSDSGSFQSQEHYIIKWQFQHLSTGRSF